MIAITTSSSIRVNAERTGRRRTRSHIVSFGASARGARTDPCEDVNSTRGDTNIPKFLGPRDSGRSSWQRAAIGSLPLGVESAVNAEDGSVSPGWRLGN